MPDSPWSQDLRSRASNTLRGLAIDATNAANSGHPGAPMGLADIAVVLFGEVMRFDPARPDWADRDRFVLSNGHASMLQYGALHLCGYDLSIEDLKAFRQLGSKTAGHPEYGVCPGVETTTGPLGQGLANAVGMALGTRMARARFGDLIDHRVYVIAGDGCLMEGISQEAISLAGHLRLSDLIVIYDDNGITIDGSTALAFSEDVPGRFRACGWRVVAVDGHTQDQVREALQAARDQSDAPTLVVAKTHIGFGSPNRQDTAKAHGEPLGAEETAVTKAALGLPEGTFVVPEEVRSAFQAAGARGAEARAAWEAKLADRQRDPDFMKAWAGFMERPKTIPDLASVRDALRDTSDATRSLSGKTLNALADVLPQMVGGSADLTGSNKSKIAEADIIGPKAFSGRNLHFGVREHAMGAICNGLATVGGLIPYSATFLAFSDYMRPAIRLAALMKLRALTVFTHDSIGLGEDGPTHQPVEQLWALRMIPGLYVWRPADGVETAQAWAYATTMGEDRPHALVFTRQKVPPLRRADDAEVLQGGYVVDDPEGPLDAVLVATGSEVSIARDAARATRKHIRVVSMPCLELFMEQPQAVRQAVLPPGVPVATLEAGRTDPWAILTGLEGLRLGLDRFGESAPYQDLYAHFGLDSASVAARLDAWELSQR